MAPTQRPPEKPPQRNAACKGRAVRDVSSKQSHVPPWPNAPPQQDMIYWYTPKHGIATQTASQKLRPRLTRKQTIQVAFSHGEELVKLMQQPWEGKEFCPTKDLQGAELKEPTKAAVTITEEAEPWEICDEMHIYTDGSVAK